MINKEVMERVSVRGKNLLYAALYDLVMVVGVMLALILLFRIRELTVYGEAELNGKIAQVTLDRNLLVEYKVLERDSRDLTGVTTYPVTIQVQGVDWDDQVNHAANSDRYPWIIRLTGMIFAWPYRNTNWSPDIVFKISQTWLMFVFVVSMTALFCWLLRKKSYAYVERVQSGDEVQKRVDGFRPLCDNRLLKYVLVLAVAFVLPRGWGLTAVSILPTWRTTVILLLAVVYVFGAESLYYFRRFFITRLIERESQSKFAKIISWIGWDQIMGHLSLEKQKKVLTVVNVILGILTSPFRFLRWLYRLIAGPFADRTQPNQFSEEDADADTEFDDDLFDDGF